MFYEFVLVKISVGNIIIRNGIKYTGKDIKKYEFEIVKRKDICLIVGFFSGGDDC